ncbi:hypothetical protein [Lysinibacillus sphaericus]|uniref:hypothetical protein n=1 Tax=Lysinibacillus sphaericus TaxID=1421 RepID=UPI003D80008F
MPSIERASQTMQRQQMAVVLVRAIKEIAGVDLVAEYKKANFVTEIGDLDKAYSAEQRTAIVALEYAGITNVAHFNPGNSVTRGQFASFLYRTIENVVNNPEAGVAAVKAINNTTVEVTFDEEVDNVQALNFLISDLEVKNAAVKLTNKKVVVLTTAAQTADKEYTVSLGEEKIGTFKGIAAVVPTKVDLVEKSVQGKLGQQVTLKAQVTVAEGQAKAGIPVTFFIPGSANGVKTPVTVEAVTNEEGIATYSYTRYAATNDTVTVYANGDRSKFSTGYVFWAVDQTLEITEVTTGATINNGANKTYKVTYKHPETGKPVSGKVLNVSVKENIDVTVDKLQNVTVNGLAVVQTSDNNTRAAQITTDSKGEATFTVSGSNAEVTPVVFEATPVTVTNTNGTVTTTGYTQKYTADTLQASAAKVKFSALQADYTIDVTRDGGETAAIGYQNGRKYKVVVKNKNGEVAKNEVVNVAFNEHLDRVISTNTDAYFVELDANGSRVYKPTLKQITVTTDAKGEASFIIANDKVSTYATPVAWIDINSAFVNKQGTLDEGEPKAIAPISYFEAEKLDGASLKVKDANGRFRDTADLKGDVSAEFKVDLVNQSGSSTTIGTLEEVTYTIYNTGSSVIYLGDAGLTTTVSDTAKISPNRSQTVKLTGNEVLKVSSYDGKSGSVKVVATGKVRHDGRDFNFTSKEATAKFTATNEVSNLESGRIASFDTSRRTLTIVGKTAIRYTGETGKNYTYRDEANRPVSLANFEKALVDAAKAGGNTGLEITYEAKDNDITFYLKSVNAPAPINTVEADKQAGIDALAKAKSDLDAAIKAVKEDNYQDKAAVQALVKTATDVLTKANATKAEYENAKTALEAGLAKLVKAPAAPTVGKIDWDTNNEIITITFASNVIIDDKQEFTIDSQKATVADLGKNSVGLLFTTAPTNAAVGTLKVKVATTETTFEKEFTYEVAFNPTATNKWTVTLKN